VIAPKTRKTDPATPKSKLTIQKGPLRVSAEIAAIAIAILKIVTPLANTFVLVDVCFRGGFLVFGFGFYFFLLFVVACGFRPIFWQWRARQRDFVSSTEALILFVW